MSELDIEHLIGDAVSLLDVTCDATLVVCVVCSTKFAIRYLLMTHFVCLKNNVGKRGDWEGSRWRETDRRRYIIRRKM